MCRRTIMLLIILFFSDLAKSQSQKDAAFWLGLDFEKKINKHLSTTFFNQYTFNQNARELGSVFFDVGLNYKVNNMIAISGNYRFAKLRNLDNYYNNIQRFYIDLTLSKWYNKFYFQFRTRIQTQIYGIDLFDHYRPNKNFSRNKITVRYRLNRIYSVSVSEEQFFRLNERNKIIANRVGIGITYKFNLKHRINLFYMNQFQKNVKNPKADFITGITYSFKL